MTANNKGLGRGLEALFNNPASDGDAQASEAKNLRYLPIDMLTPNPDQPRKHFDEESLEDLTNSIRSQGILQPLLVQGPNGEGKYEIVAGERRWRASKMAGLAELPVIVRDFQVADAMVASLVENMQRQSLNPLEEARALLTIKENLNLTQQELANALGMQRTSLTNRLRLLNLSEAAQEDLVNGRLSNGHARSLVSLPENAAESLRKRIVATGMNVRGTEMAVAFWQENGKFPWRDDENPTKYKQKDPEIKSLGKKLGNLYNCKAAIHGTFDQGKIAFTYKTNDELQEILARLGLKSPEE